MRRFGPATLYAVRGRPAVRGGPTGWLGARRRRAAPSPGGGERLARSSSSRTPSSTSSTTRRTGNGFQGFIDSEGWRRLGRRKSGGQVLRLQSRRHARQPGADRALRDRRAHERRRVDRRDACEAAGGELHDCWFLPGRAPAAHRTAWLTHDIPTLLLQRERQSADTRRRCLLEARHQDDHRRSGDDHCLPAGSSRKTLSRTHIIGSSGQHLRAALVTNPSGTAMLVTDRGRYMLSPSFPIMCG